MSSEILERAVPYATTAFSNPVEDWRRHRSTRTMMAICFIAAGGYIIFMCKQRC